MKPGNIVGAIANEAGLAGDHIGHISIERNHSLVDLPKGMPRDVFMDLKKVRVCGRPMKIALDGKPDEAKRERPSGKSDRPKRDKPGGKSYAAKGKGKPKPKPKAELKPKPKPKAKPRHKLKLKPKG